MRKKRRELVVTLEHRFIERNGIPHTRLAFSYDYWKRFLVYFEQIIVVARLQRDGGVAQAQEASVIGPGVDFFPMPYYVGPREFLKSLPRSLRLAWSLSGRHERFLLRSGNITNILWVCLSLRGKPYLREFPGSLKEGILGFTGNSGFVMRTVAATADGLARWQAHRAVACSYVSEAVRTAYPASAPDREYVFSSAELVSAAQMREHQILDGPVKIVSVGRLEREKGHRHLVRALAKASQDSGLPFQLHLIGDGSQRVALEALTKELQVDAVFHGAIVNKAKLFGIVRDSNLFVLPSETEGMPRALIEAMSLKVPCIASDVGGVPEVMDSRFLVPSQDELSLSQHIIELCGSEELRSFNAETHYAIVNQRFSQKESEETMIRFWSRLP